VRDAMAAAMPTARVEVETAEARVVRPDAGREEAEQAQSPTAAAYDPYVAYYPSPLGFVADALLWSSLFSMAMPPHYVVVDHHNHTQGFADDPGIESGPTHVPAEDPGSWWAGDDSASAGDHHSGDGGDAGSWTDGGDAGGGDLGGGDLGGGDLGGSFGSDDW
ncbi:MAG TPA: hypothetical protein VGD80_14220, partial [Kofleriaceae bacterium]